MFDRLRALVGDELFKNIQQQKILLVGLGGVGTYALEALVRNGFMNVTVVDYDRIDVTNINRQLLANVETLNKSKVLTALKHAKSINPSISIDGIERKLTESNLDDILKLGFDYVIDACDDLSVKFALMEKSLHYSYKLVSSMGTAKKIHPEKLIITTLDKTINDPLARILRKKVKDAKINKKFIVVSSDEVCLDIPSLGTANLVPSVAGLLCVSYIFNDIIDK